MVFSSAWVQYKIILYQKKLKSIGEKGVLAMICDSTNVFNQGRAGSELDVRKSLLKIMENA